MDLRLDIPWVSTSVKSLSFRCLADTGYLSAAHHSVASSLPGCIAPDNSPSRIPSVVRRGITCRSGVGQGRVLGVADILDFVKSSRLSQIVRLYSSTRRKPWWDLEKGFQHQEIHTLLILTILVLK